MKSRRFVMAVAVGLGMLPFSVFGEGRGVDDPESGSFCDHKCVSHSKRLVRDCIAAGGDKDKCKAAGQDYLERCRNACPDIPPCARECDGASEEVYAECRHEGGMPEECLSAVRAFLERCIEAHCPPPPTCEEQCLVRAKHVFEACVEDGADEEDCAVRARNFLSGCLNDNCGPPDPCEERCEYLARAQGRLCLALGGAEDECAAFAVEFKHRCVKDHCDRPPTCEEECVIRARRAYEECVGSDPTTTHDADDTNDECALLARRILNECLEENCPPPPDCRERCAHVAESAKRLCLDQGGSEERCAHLARELFEFCVADNCPPPPSCEDQCKNQSNRAFNDCLENGGSREECEGRAAHFLKACLVEHCQPPPGCVERCEEAAGQIFRGCVAAGVPEHVCREKAHAFREVCIETNCRHRCGGIQGEGCDDGSFCKFPPGECNIADNIGVCVLKPEACTRELNPVCGCDGVTYGNPCLADQAGVSIAHAGACELTCGGIAGIPCPDGMFCHFRPGQCEIVDNQGVCAPIPQACPEVYAPVCGCDGVTYGNSCEAAAAKASIDHEGPCHRECDPTDDDDLGSDTGGDCDKGEFCRIPPGLCDSSDVKGVCTTIPQACPDNVDPVCGCDGETYGNACEADAHGVSVAYRGPCRDVCGVLSNTRCTEGFVCIFPPGHCDGASDYGLCLPRPLLCPTIAHPVCGCNGHTYANECEAVKAGVSIRHPGRCEQ